MDDLELERQKKFIATIKEIRTTDFENGRPFMMLSGNLPEGQAYFEFPDGHFEVQEVLTIGVNYDFKSLGVLGDEAINALRKKYAEIFS